MATNYVMEVNKKLDNEYQKVGEVLVPVFALEEFNLPVTATGKDENGLPVYGNEAIDWVMGAVFAAIKADARNKLISGTANLKPGASIASSVAELVARAERSGAALAIAREFIKGFTDFLASHSGKSANVQAVLVSMVKNRATITLSSEARRNALLAQLTAYAENLNEEDAGKFANIIMTISELCTEAVELDDSDF